MGAAVIVDAAAAAADSEGTNAFIFCANGSDEWALGTLAAAFESGTASAAHKAATATGTAASAESTDKAKGDEEGADDDDDDAGEGDMGDASKGSIVLSSWSSAATQAGSAELAT